tara:strand:- start:1813 stop:2388 length:576 start_codon:yes stop_codon:yes gene_type:complete
MNKRAAIRDTLLEKTALINDLDNLEISRRPIILQHKNDVETAMVNYVQIGQVEQVHASFRCMISFIGELLNLVKVMSECSGQNDDVAQPGVINQHSTYAGTSSGTAALESPFAAGRSANDITSTLNDMNRLVMESARHSAMIAPALAEMQDLFNKGNTKLMELQAKITSNALNVSAVHAMGSVVANQLPNL